MQNRTTAIILTVVAALICGCPGLVGACLGATSAVVSFIPNSQIDIFGNNTPGAALTWGIVSLCGGIIFIAIPIVVGVLTLRKKKVPVAPPPADVLPPQEPLPPAS
jgi:hypothetical protein